MYEYNIKYVHKNALYTILVLLINNWYFIVKVVEWWSLLIMKIIQKEAWFTYVYWGGSKSKNINFDSHLKIAMDIFIEDGLKFLRVDKNLSTLDKAKGANRPFWFYRLYYSSCNLKDKFNFY